MTGGGPLGRESLGFTETMKLLHGEIERLVYAAEITCPHKEHKEVYKCKTPCAFHSHMDSGYCTLICFRGDLGDHIEQHDAMPAVPPCQCGGRCNK